MVSQQWLQKKSSACVFACCSSVEFCFQNITFFQFFAPWGFDNQYWSKLNLFSTFKSTWETFGSNYFTSIFRRICSFNFRLTILKTPPLIDWTQSLLNISHSLGVKAGKTWLSFWKPIFFLFCFVLFYPFGCHLFHHRGMKIRNTFLRLFQNFWKTFGEYLIRFLLTIAIHLVWRKNLCTPTRSNRMLSFKCIYQVR